MTKKVLLTPLLILIACVLAGAYGAIHNQISYTVSPEYFTKFKFAQFRIPAGLPERVGAALVGCVAAWWMGAIVSVFLLPVGLKIPGALNYFWGMIKAFCGAIVTALVVGLIALAASFVVVQIITIAPITRYGNEILDDSAFLQAGIMHDFSYFGGLLGVIAGWRTILRTIRSHNSSHRPLESDEPAT